MDANQKQDFSQPWKFSDVVLVVEEERLHVHRGVLAMASPVFDTMFTSEFQEKYKNEIPLPGKSSTEVKELLSLIYPSTSEKQITLENCYFLVKLAHEYQMDAIVKKCEGFLVDELKTKPKDGILSDLVFAQTYKLEKLRQASVDRAQNLYTHYLEELKQDKMYDEIQSENLKEIMEGIIRQLQRESEESQRINDENKNKSDAVKLKLESALQEVDEVVNILFEHAVSKKHTVSNFEFSTPSTENCIGALQMDEDKDNIVSNSQYWVCSSLRPAAGCLQSLKEKLESLTDKRESTYPVWPGRLVRIGPPAIWWETKVIQRSLMFRIELSFLPKQRNQLTSKKRSSSEKG